MARLGLVDQADIARWADSREAPGDLPRLIRRLILETGRGIVQLGFPSGEGIATEGWDGTVRATEATAFIPSGLSLWELSARKNAQAKAEKDYAKRLGTPDGSLPENCTYVAVSLRRWAKRLEWARTKSSEGRWKEVRAYAIDDLEAWLESAPVTHAWLSELLGLHPHGLLSAETWWTFWSKATSPSFPAAVVLAGRIKEADALRAELAGPGHIITIQGASREDVFAFVSALALTDAEADRGSLLSRLALVDKVETWRRLRDHPVPLALVPRTQEVVDDLGLECMHHLVVPIVDGEDADIRLPPIDFQEAQQALVAAGLGEKLAEETGRLARLSLLTARRRIARKRELHRPPWATAPVPRLQRRALLLGKWNERSTEDVAIVSRLFEGDYNSVREDLASLMAAEDPLFARFDTSIGLVSHFDAWLLLRGALREEDLQAFQEAALEVFSKTNPAFDLPPEDRWMAPVLGKVPAHSADLRLGMATTLALLGSHGDMVVAGSGLTGQEWASWTLRRIFEAANQDRTCHLWASLRDVLRLVAEAAPSTFLEAVRDGLQGESPLLLRMFMDREDSSALFTDSPHSSLLWALEVCAWSPTDFGQAVDLLARLAEIDPGGRLANRPFGCLVSIFRPWYPQNSVGVERCLIVLDGLRKRHGSIAWRLMISLLPSHGGHAIEIPGPRFRDWKPETINVGEGEYQHHIEEICRRLLEDVGPDSAKWVSLIWVLPKLLPPFRSSALSSLVALSTHQNCTDQEREQIWSALQDLATRHREYSQSASWAMPAAEIERIAEAAEHFRPSDLAKQFSWLFNESMPKLLDVKRNAPEYEPKLTQLRTEAAVKIATSSTWPGLHRFAISTKMPGAFGWSLAQANMPGHDSNILELLSSNESTDFQFAFGYLSNRFRAEGWPWIEDHLREGNLSPEQSARLLLATDEFPKSWEIAESVGEDTSSVFWRNFRAFGLGHNFQYAVYAAQRMLRVGRPGSALELLVLYMPQDVEDERADLMASCLEELLRCDPKGTEAAAASHHDLGDVFSYLSRSTISSQRLAKLEWAYLKIFDHHASPPTLSRYLAQDPSFFVEVVSSIYRPRPLEGGESEELASDPEVEPDEAHQALATKTYQLLSRWRTVPGSREDGTIDGDFLGRWVDEARQLLRAANRSEVGDLHIGMVLAASSPGQDGIRPSIEVRDLLEALQATKIEDGLRLQFLNGRGVTMRGMFDGGEQEVELAAKYSEQADRLTDRWPRTAAILRSLAKSYEREARRQDDEVERRRKGFET